MHKWIAPSWPPTDAEKLAEWQKIREDIGEAGWVGSEHPSGSAHWAVRYVLDLLAAAIAERDRLHALLTEHDEQRDDLEQEED